MGTADIKLGYSCNNNCIFCAVKHHPAGNKSTGQYIAEMESARARNNRIVITGGEPTIRADLPNLVRAAKMLGYRITIQTNGRRFSDDSFCRDISSLGVSNFLVSIHGHEAEIHERLTGVANSFRETEQGIINLLHHNQNIQSNSVMTVQNTPYLNHLTKYLIHLGITNIMFSYLDICGAVLDNIEILPEYSKIIDKMGEVITECKGSAVKVCFDNIPLCQMPPEYRKYATEKRKIDLIMHDYQILEFKANTIIDSCLRCAVRSYCCHPQQKYIDLFGNQFSPV